MPKSKDVSGAAAKLAGLSMFADFTDDEIHQVAAAVEEVDAEPGAVLTEQGKPGLSCYIIVAGEASVEKGTDPIATLGPGDLCGELALLDNNPRSATVRATTPMQLLVLDSRHFRRLLDDMPRAKTAVLAHLSGRLRE